MNTTSAVASWYAVWIEIIAFAAPGPRVTIAMPGRWVRRASVRAANPAPPSCRHTTVWTGESYSPSSTSRNDSPGTV